MTFYSDIISVRIPLRILLISMLSIGILLLVVFCTDKIRNKQRFVLWVLLVEFIFITICSTIFCRKTLPTARLELMPFWTYNAISNPILGVSAWGYNSKYFVVYPFWGTC